MRIFGIRSEGGEIRRGKKTYFRTKSEAYSEGQDFANRNGKKVEVWELSTLAPHVTSNDLIAALNGDLKAKQIDTIRPE